jgi:glutathione synthase/RimK-type ligase-like ATP-grasp enzyme
MRSVALVTYSKSPQLHEDDLLLVEPLKQRGFEPSAVPWDEKKVAWEKFHFVILRSPWDYHYRLNEYLDWLSKLETLDVRLWNPVPIIRWNINKIYLRELEERGIAIVPTVWLNQGTRYSLQSILESKNWREAVVKPTVGASGFKIFRARIRDAQMQQLETDELLQRTSVMVQPFMEEIQSKGEYSFIFIGGKYSHTVLKRPQPNEFRVNQKFRGIWTLDRPKDDLIQQAIKIHGVIAPTLLYARLDVLDVEGHLIVIEVEVNDPTLFFRWYPQAAVRFAEVLKNIEERKPHL